MAHLRKLVASVGSAVVLTALIVGCSNDPAAFGAQDSSSTTAPRAAADNAVFRATLASVPTNPLVAELTVSSDVAVTAEVTLTNAEDSSETRVLSGWPAETAQRLAVVGMTPEAAYDVDVQLVTADGKTYGEPQTFEFETGPLPDDLPEMETTVDASLASAGDVLFNLLDLRTAENPAGATNLDPDRDRGHLLIVNSVGDPIWYFRHHEVVGDATWLPNGNVIAELGDSMTAEINLFGEIESEWAGRYARGDVGGLLPDAPLVAIASDDAVALDVDAIHHEHTVLESGNHLTLSSELRTVSGFGAPLCGESLDDFDGSYELAGDRVIEFDPVTGELVKDFSLFDYFDPLAEPAIDAVCEPAPWVFPLVAYVPNVAPDARDWTHANAVVLDTERNALIVSVRHLNAVIAIRYEDDADGVAGDLLWRLGPGGSLAMNQSDYSYYQHAPEVQSDGSLLVYDNGNFRTDATSDFSRVVLYAIDDQARTAEVAWQYRSEVDGDPAYAGFVGDADRMVNGNVMIVDGGMLYGVNGVFAQITEVKPQGELGGEVAFNLRVTTQGFGIYRAERLESLVPAGPIPSAL